VLSVLKISKAAKAIDGVVKAKESIPYRIYKKNFIKGVIAVDLKFPPKIVGTRVVVFYAIDPAGPKEPSCGGEEVIVSDPDGSHFGFCEASSSFPGGEYDCQYAFSKKMEDAPFAMWVTNGEGVSAWLELTFKFFVQITAIEFRNRVNPGERAKSISMKFSDGSTVTNSLRNTPSPIPLKLKATTTKSVKFTIESVYSTINNGGAFNIMGVPCMEEEGISQREQSGKIKLKC